jgi:hypothetical protein
MAAANALCRGLGCGNSSLPEHECEGPSHCNDAECVRSCCTVFGEFTNTKGVQNLGGYISNCQQYQCTNSSNETAPARVNVFTVMMQAAANLKPNNAQRPQTKPEPRHVGWVCLTCNEMGQSPGGLHPTVHTHRIPVCKCKPGVVAQTRYTVQGSIRSSGLYKVSVQEN